MCKTHLYVQLQIYLYTSGGVDYDPLSSFVLSFAEGSSQGDQQCTTISITDDIAVESTESFRVELSTSDPQVAFSAICPSAPVRITDSDGMILGTWHVFKINCCHVMYC